MTESVAEYLQKPLLRLDAGTLGTTATSVENALKENFTLAERWNALLLLDEADVYLEQRKPRSLVHNGLVSGKRPYSLVFMNAFLKKILKEGPRYLIITRLVFLRMLEYYHGIIFLTTNRISAFDRAFVSRIHIAIHYPSLSLPVRRELWYSLLKQISNETAEVMNRDGVLNKLAEEPLNGRQIKNIIRIAYALALSDGSASGRISERHLQASVRPIRSFTKDVEHELEDSNMRKSREETEQSPVDEEVGEESEKDGDENDIDDEAEEYDEEYDEEDEEEDEDELEDASQPNKRRRLE